MKIKTLKVDEIVLSGRGAEEIKRDLLKAYDTKTVLGIDIYKYSEYSEDIQIFIPVVFNSLYQGAIKNCLNKEKYIFQSYATDIEGFMKNFISTGDGGFQIFENPLEALVFSIYFQLHMKKYNSRVSGSYPIAAELMRNLVGKIELRYAITLGKIYEYDKNFYGPSIINNARILSKDNLNRMLIDENILDWFDNTINSIENLMTLTMQDFQKIPFFSQYKPELLSTLFSNQSIKTIDILKIGAIRIKSTDLKIYNLHIQAGMYADNPEGKRYTYYTMTLGNLNTKGIE